MSTKEIANRLVELCRTGQWEAAQKELYADNCVSIEPKGSPAELVEGLDAIIKKGEQFNEMVEKFNSLEVSEPLVAENFFTITMNLDADFKGMGRVAMEEVCVYEVVNGKIVKEQFFFTPQPQG
ncbi:MAG: nuclear transport factor 2 family protein [Cyclobacteriaceae bacterium]